MWKSTRDDIHTSRGIGVSHLTDLHHLVAASEAAGVWLIGLLAYWRPGRSLLGGWVPYLVGSSSDCLASHIIRAGPGAGLLNS